MKRAVLALAALVALLVGGAAALFFLEGPRLLEHAIRTSAHALGYQEVQVSVSTLGLRRTEIASFSAGPAPGLSAEDVSIEWTLPHLLAARVASVEVGSAVIHGVWTEEGIEFPALPPAEEGPLLTPPSWDRVQMAHARVELGGPKGPVSVALRDIDLGAPPGERMRARLEASVERPAGRLTGDVDVVLDGDRVSGHARLRDAKGTLDLSADLGEPGPAPGRFPDVWTVEELKLAGRIDVKAEAADLSPLTPSLTATGAIEFRLADGTLHVDSDSLDLAGFGMDLAGLELAVKLSEVSPPSAPPGQRVAVRRLQFGMDVGGGELRFGVDPGGVVAIESLDWRFQGGELKTSGRFDPMASSNELVIGVAHVDLWKLVADLGRNDLMVTGELSGELPIRIEGDRIFATGGRLTASEAGGVIRYRAGGLPAPGVGEPAERPASGSVSGVALVLDALENFQYRKLEVGVEGELTGEMTLKLTLEGSNPDVYDGYPFQLNLNLEGPLADIIEGSSTGFRIQDSIEERFQNRGKKP